MPIDLLNFVRKWNASQHAERGFAADHFRDLCEVLEVSHPTDSDEIGASYTYEKRVAKAGTGEQGYADVWKRGFFAWEYKSKGGDLKKAYKQLNEYREGLDNPPLLVVCDFVRFEVHTNFENLPSRTYAFTLDDLLVPRDTATCALPPLEVLRHVFGDFNQLRPGVASARVTEAAATDFLRLAQRLESEKAAAPTRPGKEEIAHFLMRLVFCLFADSVGLLPRHTFRELVKEDRHSPIRFNRKLPYLFAAMSEEHGFFGVSNIPYFNGGLFSDNRIIELDHADLGILHSASQHDWSHIEPAIFGTLFERSLDAAKRSMIGAHYTSSEDILLLIEPVVIAPLERRWQTVQQHVLAALADEKQDGLKLNRPALEILQNWAAELAQIRILDPACGSGNFLYIALKRLLDLWQQARAFGVRHGLTLALDPIPHPGQLFGIETDFYAHEIASIVVWIGFLQWKHDHGVKDEKEPLLKVLTNIQHADAILRYDAEGKPYEPTWPPAEYIVGNPPFLGGKLLRRELGDQYVDALFDLYQGRVKAESDLVVYWFEKARQQLELEQVDRVGLLATQGIRGGANRAVLERIQQSGTIFWAWSDRPWLLKGATVHVSMIAFKRPEAPHSQTIHQSPGAPSIPTVSASGWVGSLEASAPPFNPATTPGAPCLDSETWASTKPISPMDTPFLLDGQPVPFINPDLTTGFNIAAAEVLRENAGISFQGPTKVGKFEIPPALAHDLLARAANPNGRLNSDVVKPWINGLDITGRPRGMFIIDFGTSMTESQAALYEEPFEHIKRVVWPERRDNKRALRAKRWWLHGETYPAMRRALLKVTRYVVTPRVSKHRIFLWQNASTFPDSAVVLFAREDDYFFGMLHSSAHELWARAQGTQLREVESGFRYTPNSTFDTFPFPWPPGTEPTEAEDPRVHAIAEAARTLVRLRDAWLNPPDTPEEDLKKRTLTNLYNQRPTWLDHAHRTLDQAVFAAYGWPCPLPTDDKQEILARLLALNHQRAAAQPPPKPAARSPRRPPTPRPPE
jgi:type II restriction/modification system DNA methylase subunit YeeA